MRTLPQVLRSFWFCTRHWPNNLVTETTDLTTQATKKTLGRFYGHVGALVEKKNLKLSIIDSQLHR